MSLQFVLRSKTSGLAPGTKAFPSGAQLCWPRFTHLQAPLSPVLCPPRWPCFQCVPPAPPPLPPAVAVLPACALRDRRPSPVVDDLPLTAAVAVVVQNDVAITAVELSVRGGVHGHFVGTFNSPDLPEQSWAQTSGGIPGPHSDQLRNQRVLGSGYTTGLPSDSA